MGGETEKDKVLRSTWWKLGGGGGEEWWKEEGGVRIGGKRCDEICVMGGGRIVGIVGEGGMVKNGGKGK